MKEIIQQIILFIMFFAAMMTFFYFGSVYGGRKACFNSDGYLAEGFKCEPFPEQDNNTIDLLNLPGTPKFELITFPGPAADEIP